MKVFFSLLTFILLSTNAAFAVTCSTDICTIANGTTVDITRHNLCSRLTNATGASLMVPTKTSAELSSFIAAGAIAGVTKANCPPYFLSAVERSLASGGTFNNNKPAGLAAGDLMIAHIYNSGTLATISPPAGFAAVPNNSNYPTPGTTYYSTKLYKIASAGDAAAANNSVNFRMTMSPNFSSAGYMITVYRNVNQTTPIQTATQNSGAWVANITYTGATNATANSIGVISSEASNLPNTRPAGFTIDSSQASHATEYSSKVLSATGATGNFTATYSSANNWCSALIIINPP